MLKEHIVNQEVNFTLSLLAVSLVQQNQMLKQQNAMLRDLMDHVDAVEIGRASCRERVFRIV